MASLAAPRVPVAWEERLGEAVIAHVAPVERRCADSGHASALDKIVATLTAPLRERPYTFRVIVVDDPVINALAAPGGFIVVFRGLLEQTRSAEELAGVLAHEAQHILLRHSTRAVLEHASTGLLVAALTGDVTGAMSYGLESGRVLGLLRYSRRNEEEADRAGMQMLLASGIDPSGMITFYELLRKRAGEVPTPLTYLSTHPSPGDRIEKLKALAGASPTRFVKLLPDSDWREVQKLCQGGQAVK